MLQKGLNVYVMIAIFMGAILMTATLQASGADDPAHHGGGGGGSMLKAKGRIAAVDVAGSSVTISDNRTGALVQVFADASTEIRKNNIKNAAVADLTVGDRVEARYDAASFVAKEIRAKSAKVEGTLTMVDLAANTVTITPLGGTPVVLNVTPATKIERNEIHVTLGQLVVGDAAEAKFDATTMNASKIETTGL